MVETLNAFKMAQAQFDSVAERLNVEPYIAEMLRWPMREFKSQFGWKVEQLESFLVIGFSITMPGVRLKAGFASTQQKLWIPSGPWPCG